MRADDIDLRWIARNTMSLAVAEVCNHAADEIERLRAALDYAVSELLPVHDHWGEFDHHEVVAHFLEEARRG